MPNAKKSKCPYNPLIPQQMPPQIAALKVDARGYPIPWFVPYKDGEPNFQAVEIERITAAVKHKLCWVCGKPLNANMAFAIGPMCAVNRISAEPPQHRECSEFSARACPFLVNPQKERPPSELDKAETMILRNPGVVLVWVTLSYKLEKCPETSRPLFRLGDPISTTYFAEGRAATRAQVVEAVESGLPILEAMAVKDGAGAQEELKKMVVIAEAFYPHE